MFARIQQGRLRGRKIPLPSEIKGQAHFTPALIKEVAFQLFENFCVPDRTVFFDLCAGSGQMGFEAASRDYKKTILAEVDGGRISHLRATAKQLDLEAGEGRQGVEIMRRDFRRSPALLATEERVAVYLDPPYSFWTGGDCPPLREFFRKFQERRQEASLPDEFVFIVQGPEALSLDDLVDSDSIAEIRRQGSHNLTIWRSAAADG